MSASAGKTILLVDDDESERLLFRLALESKGYRTIEATGGQAGVAACERAFPDLVILDAIFPGMDGFEACRRMRQIEGMEGVPIVVLSGLQSENARVAASKAGATGFVRKTADFASLMDQVLHTAGF